MNIKESVQNASESVCKNALEHILDITLNPALGSASKREIELAVLVLLC